MSEIKARAIVLKETNVGESDKILTLLSKDYGKLTVSAKGARKPTGKLFSGSKQFCYGDFYIKKTSKHSILTQIETIESFYKLSNDLFSLAYATYLSDLAERTSMPEQENNDTLLLLIRALTRLMKGYNPLFIASFFEIKLLQINGYMIEARNCISCGKKPNSLFLSSSGLLCEECCKTAYCIPISLSTVNALNYIFSSGIDSVFKHNISEETLEELKRVCEMLMSYHIPLELKSKSFIKEL